MPFNLEKMPSPCYVLEEEKLLKNLKLMGMVQKASGGHIILALKGFAMYSCFPTIAKYLQGTTASSLHEAMLGAKEFGGEVHAYSPAYLPNEFDQLLDICTHLSFNSLSQWERFKDIVWRHPKEHSIGLRINPEYAEVSTDLYNPCAIGSRLGVTASQIGDSLPKGIEGLHFHTLCESSAEALERTLEKIEAKFGHLLHQAKWLNMGGGHLMTGQGYNVDLLIQLIKHLRENYKIKVILEPGSAVAWQTGFLIATVLDIVENQGVKTLMLDTSFSAHMPDCLEMPYKPKVRNSVENGENVYRLGGLTCLAGDFMGDYAFDQPIKIGDRLIFEDMMHYTMVKNNTFNGVNLPSIGILGLDQKFKLVKSFGYEDYRTRLS